MHKETTPPSSLNNLPDKTIYLPYTPPVLIVLEDSTIENNNCGLGLDGGAYPNNLS